MVFAATLLRLNMINNEHSFALPDTSAAILACEIVAFEDSKAFRQANVVDSSGNAKRIQRCVNQSEFSLQASSFFNLLLETNRFCLANILSGKLTLVISINEIIVVIALNESPDNAALSW